jgi:hypothetical protein
MKESRRSPARSRANEGPTLQAARFINVKKPR